MGDGLQNVAGDNLRAILDRFTTSPFMGILVGIAVTILLQSSSGTTVIVVVLVGAGLMTLKQAIGVIMGAHIGTTATAFIIGFDIGIYAYPTLLIGAVMLFFFKGRTIQSIGQIFFGFGGLFIGIEIMSSGFSPLRDHPYFFDLMLQMGDNSLMGATVGIIFTIIVQSSSATIGILQGLYAEELIGLSGALPLLLGANLGTTLTALLATPGAGPIALRAAAIHILLNVFGLIVFMVFLAPYTSLITWLGMHFSLEPMMQIAFAHGTFNLINIAIQVPLIGFWAYIVTRFIPEKPAAPPERISLYLDASFIKQSTTIAVGQARKEVLRMGQITLDDLKNTLSYLETREPHYGELTHEMERSLNLLVEEITHFIVAIFPKSVSKRDSNTMQVLLNVISDLERIGDHCENIVEQVDFMIRNEIVMTDEAKDEIRTMFNLVVSSVTEAITSLSNRDATKALKVYDLEREINVMEKELRKRHINRLNHGECTPRTGLVFTDLISNFERIGDHAKNIADMTYEKYRKA